MALNTQEDSKENWLMTKESNRPIIELKQYKGQVLANSWKGTPMTNEQGKAEMEKNKIFPEISEIFNYEALKKKSIEMTIQANEEVEKLVKFFFQIFFLKEQKSQRPRSLILTIFLQKYVLGSMPATQQWVKKQNTIIKYFDAVFRGIGQVVFMNNPLSGLFITAGMLVSSKYQALCMLLGVCSSTLAALILQLNEGAYLNGIYGYNGVLVGTGISVFSFGDDENFWAIPQIVLPIVLMSACSTVFRQGIGNLLVGKMGISPFTIPFILAVWIWLLGASGPFTYFPVNGNILQPSLNINMISLNQIEAQNYEIGQVIEAFFKGVSQVYFQSNTLCGILMLIGMLICSPISAFFAIFGSAVSTLTGMMLGVDPQTIYFGLFGYSATLTSIALGGMFFVMNSVKAFFFTMFGSITTGVVQGATASFLQPFGLPALTFPFNFVSWIFCLAGRGVNGINAVELDSISLAQNHIKTMRLVTNMASQFKDLAIVHSFMKLDKPQQIRNLEKQLAPVLLCWYASIGDNKGLQELIDLGVDINEKDYDGRTALHLAAANEHIDTMKLLLRQNDVKLVLDKQMQSPLNEAIRAGSLKAIVLILSQFPETEIIDKLQINSMKFATQLCIAAAENDFEKISFFVTGRVSLNWGDYDGRRPLHIAASKGRENMCNFLIENGGKMDVADNLGHTALSEANRHQNFKEKLQLQPDGSTERTDIESPIKKQAELIRAELQVMYQSYENLDNLNSDRTQKTLITVILCNTVKQGDYEKFKGIMDSYDGDVSQLYQYDLRTPLHIAAAFGQQEMTKILIKRGAQINASDRWNQKPLYEAVMNNKREIVKILVANRATLGLIDIELAIFLNQLVSQNDVQLLRLVLMTGVTVNCWDYDDRSPLHVAGDLGLEDVYRFLVSSGADTNQQDTWGNVPSIKVKNEKRDQKLPPLKQDSFLQN